jgi:IclR family acetate operon transcriptional repressor
MEMTAKPRTEAPGTARTLDVLEFLSRAGEAGATASEVARALELPHNTTTRVLDVLVERGWVRADAGRRHVLGSRLLEIARPRVGDRSLAGAALDPLCRLRDATGETAQLTVRSQNKAVILEQAASRQPVKVLGEVGFRVPLYSCAPGKAILAALPKPDLDAYLAQVVLRRWTPATRATRKELLRDLDQCRRRGYALDLAEGMAGIHCVGAPVLDAHGLPLCAVTVIAPAFRLPARLFPKVGADCVAAARDLERRLRA